jgi:hypothetical protein
MCGLATAAIQRGRALGCRVSSYVQSNQPCSETIERIQTVARLVTQRVIVHETKGHWKLSLQEDKALPALVAFDG